MHMHIHIHIHIHIQWENRKFGGWGRKREQGRLEEEGRVEESRRENKRVGQSRGEYRIAAKYQYGQESGS
jgi:hypothetical protein